MKNSSNAVVLKYSNYNVTKEGTVMSDKRIDERRVFVNLMAYFTWRKARFQAEIHGKL